MPNLPMTVQVTRELLGLEPLEINDHLNYVIAGGEGDFLGAPVSYDRNDATSPFLDGAVNVSATRAMVPEKVTVECFGDTPADTLQNVKTLRQAVTQQRYELGVGHVAGADVTWWFRYACTKADYQLGWTGPRIMAEQVQLILTIYRQPRPLQGAV